MNGRHLFILLYGPEKKETRETMTRTHRIEVVSSSSPRSSDIDDSHNSTHTTMGTASLLPVQNSEQTTSNPSANIMTVNNQTEVVDPTLPANIKAYKDRKGQTFYVNSETMITSWKHPNDTSGWW